MIKVLSRLLVLSPAGRIYGHNNVEWFPESFHQILTSYFNIGDMVVFDSTLKMLSYSYAEGLVIDNVTEEMIDHYKTFDAVILRASNFIHNDMNWDNAIKILDRLDIPVIAIGVGAQASGYGLYQLDQHNLSFWKLISERSTAIGVRGEFSAELLKKNGINNVEVVGCPTLFRGRNRDLHIENPVDIRKVAFSVRSEVDHTYTVDALEYLSTQRNLLLNFIHRFETRVTIHGEPAEKAFYYHEPEEMIIAERTFLAQGWWTPEVLDEMREIYKSKLFFFLKVSDYDEFIVKQDFAIGYRVHGVLPALANGVAGALVTYDSRSGELAKTHKIPTLDINTQLTDSYQFLRNVDFSDFNSQFPKGYDKMRSLILRNGLGSKL